MTAALKRTTYAVTDRLGWLLVEIADKTDHWGPFAWVYRAGNWCYARRLVAEGLAARPVSLWSRIAAFVRRVLG